MYCRDCMYLFVIFFFKQKTAYKVRISDWSSDVCSSDLVGAPLGEDLRDVGAGPHHGDVRDAHTVEGKRVRFGHSRVSWSPRIRFADGDALEDRKSVV